MAAKQSADKISRKLRKVKSLYEMLNRQNRLEAESKADSSWFGGSQFIVFYFNYDTQYKTIDLMYFRCVARKSYLVKNHFDIEVDDSISFLSHGNLLDCVSFGAFYNRKYPYSDAIKFVRAALRNGISSMNYGVVNVTVKAIDYLDFTSKSDAGKPA